MKKNKKILEGVSNTIKEFSDTYKNLYNSWKYVVEQDDTSILIKYIEYNKENKNWEEKSSMSIPFGCVERLIYEVSECLKRGDFKEAYNEDEYDKY